MHGSVDTAGAARPSRRAVLAGGATLAALAAGRAAVAQEAEGQADFLFVQTAQAMAFDADQNRLTLRGVSPVTLFFSDRPERIAGNMKTEAFVPFWSQGSDSFLSDPPNADLSILEDGTLRQTVVELQDPVFEGEDLHYTIRVIDGEMPVLGEVVSVVIDIIGMPLTPLSYAGVARRGYGRHMLPVIIAACDRAVADGTSTRVDWYEAAYVDGAAEMACREIQVMTRAALDLLPIRRDLCAIVELLERVDDLIAAQRDISELR